MDVPAVLLEHIPNVYTEILKEEEAGNVIIRRYADIDPVEQKEVANRFRDDLEEPLLFAKYRDFVYEHFSPLWD